VLVLAAGAQSNVRAYCQGLVRRSGTTTSGGGTTTSTG
jgi:hypothetical protein